MFSSVQPEVLLLADPAAAASGPSMIQTVVLFGGIIAVMYFFIFMPQRKEQKAKEDLLSSLAKDDRVVLASGLHGRVVSVDTHTVVVEIASKTQVTVDKAAVARKEDQESSNS